MLHAKKISTLMNIHLNAHEIFYLCANAVIDRHWVVKIDSGKVIRKVSSNLGLDEFYREGDQFFFKLSFCDDVGMQKPLTGDHKLQVVKPTRKRRQ